MKDAENVAAGEALRDAAIEASAKRQAGEEPGWPDRALACFIEFAKVAKGQQRPAFATEDVVRHAVSKGIEAKEPRAWGSVARRAVLRGVVRPAGFGKSLNPAAHRRPVQLWQPM